MLLLFSARCGLLYFHPLMWFAVIGLGLLCISRQTRWFGCMLLIPCMLEVWIDSAVLDWHGASSHGARRLVSLSVVFILGASFAFARVHNWLRSKPHRYPTALGLGLVGTASLVAFGLSTHLDTYEGPVPSHTLYSTGLRDGWRELTSWTGNPFVLPASLLYAARYRVKPKRFDDIYGGAYRRNYKPIQDIGSPTTDLRRPQTASLIADGFVATPSGFRLDTGKGRLLLELYWPWITDVTLVGKAVGSEPVDVEMRVWGLVSRSEPIKFRFEPSERAVNVPVPEGAFDSGVNEVVIKASGPITLSKWTWKDNKKRNDSVR